MTAEVGGARPLTVRPQPSDGQSRPARRTFAHAKVLADRVFRGVSFGSGAVTTALMSAVGLFLLLRAGSALKVAGLGFFTTYEWDPEAHHFGVAAVLFGTVSIALVAMVISVPLATGTALFISELAPSRMKRMLITLVDLMAAVPSVVFGLWGFFFLQEHVIPVSSWLSSVLGWVPIFKVDTDHSDPLASVSIYTSSAFIAGIVVALMVVPIQTSVMREAFSQTPAGEREGALALGATRWGMIQQTVLPFGRGAMIGGTMLGLGRALGETIAVYMIISPIFTINWHVLQSGSNSVSALIALQYGEASDFGLSALMAAGLTLYVITLVINFTAASIVTRSRSGAESEV